MKERCGQKTKDAKINIFITATALVAVGTAIVTERGGVVERKQRNNECIRKPSCSFSSSAVIHRRILLDNDIDHKRIIDVDGVKWRELIREQAALFHVTPYHDIGPGNFFFF